MSFKSLFSFITVQFLPSVSELLIDALFKPLSRVNPEHKPKYIFVLSYAASVTEVYKKVSNPLERYDESEYVKLLPSLHLIVNIQIIISLNSYIYASFK